MRFSAFSAALLAGAAMVDAVPAPNSVPAMISKYNKYVDTTLAKSKTSCNKKTVVVRKEWRSLSVAERKKYIEAVKCLTKKKTTANPSQVPGARNRLDDFVASHSIEAPKIHFNGHMFFWHRHFAWLYEQALRNECGWTGGQPYWDWSLDAKDVTKSPVFDGSPTSIGSNGKYIPHGSLHFEGFGGLSVDLPPGTGGGCMVKGPFSDLTVNIGATPILAPPGEVISPPAGNGTGLEYNPHCITRDLGASKWASQIDTSFVEYLLQAKNVDGLQKRIDGLDPSKPILQQPQMHAAGHFIVGGQNNDPLAAPADPAFFLVHSQLDRLLTIWQGQDPNTRKNQVGGTTEPVDLEYKGPKVTPNDKLAFDVISHEWTLKDLTAPLEAQYCYRYE